VARPIDFSVIVGQLYKMVSNEVLHKYVPDYERESILVEEHGGVV